VKKLTRIALVLPAVLLLAVGCSSNNAHPVAVGTKTYHDAKYKFSFQYPTSWSIPSSGHMASISGVMTYLLTVKVPNNSAGIQVTVDQNLAGSQYGGIPEGKLVPYGGDTLHYHHLTVSGWPAIQIERYTGQTLDGISTITNTHSNSFDVQMITATPPFTGDVLSGYHTIVRTMKLPF
jgi:hypothetical protein